MGGILGDLGKMPALHGKSVAQNLKFDGVCLPREDFKMLEENSKRRQVLFLEPPFLLVVKNNGTGKPLGSFSKLILKTSKIPRIGVFDENYRESAKLLGKDKRNPDGI